MSNEETFFDDCNIHVTPDEYVGTLPPEYVNTICLPGKGQETCAYLMMSPGGWECAKDNPGIHLMIQERLQKGTIRAQGDNCRGWFVENLFKGLKEAP